MTLVMAARPPVAENPGTMPMLCPNCRVDLDERVEEGNHTWFCPRCAGLGCTMAVLRRIAPPARVAALWQMLRKDSLPSVQHCPDCSRPFTRILSRHRQDGPLELDGCVNCQFIWFDGGELARFSPERSEPAHAGGSDDPLRRRTARIAAGTENYLIEAPPARMTVGFEGLKHLGALFGWD